MKRSYAFIFLALYVFVCGCRAGSAPTASAPAAAPAAFDANRSFEDLSAQCALGPRVPGTAGHAACLNYIRKQLKLYMDEVSVQPFVWRDPEKKIDVPMTNIFGVINSGGSPKIMLCAHWDTRPTAEQDFTPSNRHKPIPGADDGASGVAVLLEIARVLHENRPNASVILAFWDGEDWGPGENNMYVGASYFAKNPGAFKPDEAVLIDMIGQKNLQIPMEANSKLRCPDLVQRVWDAAKSAGAQNVFVPQTDYSIDDDHVPLLKAGIPCIDLIDFNYAYWHTLDDTPDKCSPESLGAVGRTLLEFVGREGIKKQ